jgi:hypothetical protein
MIFQRGLCLFLGLLLNSCAHSYHYAPEISGDGATWSRDGVLFAVPAQAPTLKMTLAMRSLKEAPKKANFPAGTQVIHVRMSFSSAALLAGAKLDTGAYLEPQEQILLTFGDIQTPPAIVRASSKHRPRILLDAPKQVVDLFYPLPRTVSASDIQWFSLQWKIRFPAGRFEQQVTRFDRRDSAPQNSSDFDDYSTDTVGLPIDDWGWWGPE